MGQAVLEVLRRLPFVEDMEPHHVEALAALAKEVTFEKDHVIFREGDSDKQFYIILSGKVALEVTSLSGPIRVYTVAEGRELGWSFMMARTRRHFGARAIEPVRALKFEGTELQKACDEDPAFGYKLMRSVLRVLAGRLQATRTHVLDNYGR